MQVGQHTQLSLGKCAVGPMAYSKLIIYYDWIIDHTEDATYPGNSIWNAYISERTAMFNESSKHTANKRKWDQQIGEGINATVNPISKIVFKSNANKNRNFNLICVFFCSFILSYQYLYFKF